MAAMIRRLARNPTGPSPEKLTSSNVVDLEGSSSATTRKHKSAKKKTETVTIDEVFSNPTGNLHTMMGNSGDENEQGDSEQDRHMQASSDEDHNNPEQIAADSEDEVENAEQVATAGEDEETELMVDVDEEVLVYEELEPRIDCLRAQHQALIEATPSLRNLPRRPVNGIFHSATAAARYEELTSRTVLIQKFLPLDDDDLLDARKIIEKSQLMYTMLDVPSFTEEIVLEFYANLGNMIKRGGTTWVYVRSRLYEFSPRVINDVFGTRHHDSDFPRKPWTKENLDASVVTVTGGKKQRWGNLKMLDVTPMMNILFKFCVFNWMPTANRSTLTIDRIKFLHMITEGRPFDFGVMVFDQIFELGQQQVADVDKKPRLLFPNLIQHILDAQHPLPARDGDSVPQDSIRMVLDKKQGVPKKPSGAGSSRRYSLANDVGRMHRLLDTVIARAASKYALPCRGSKVNYLVLCF